MDKDQSKVRFFGLTLFLALAISVAPARAGLEVDPFPMYPVIQPNVSFWEDIYSRYSSNQGVLHDNRQLNIVYEVIDLKHPYRPGSSRINRQRIRAAKKKYRDILRKLARGEAPADPDEKRVADLFGPAADPATYVGAARNIRCQVGQRDFFRAGLIRSGAYLGHIRRIFRRNGLPEDLAYLPHVESSFNPEAYSKFGAAGMWQFTRSTGKRFMTVGYSVDERRDPIIASRAAARLLKRNYERLRDWPLAITAYNHGLNGMLRAQKAEGSYTAIFSNYRSRIFKFASRNFYSEFLAARHVAKNYRTYFGELQMDPPLSRTQVVLAGYASFPRLARALDMAPETLRALNPALRKPVVSGRKYVPRGYRLNLPAEPYRDWEALLAGAAEELFRSEQKHSRFYTVRRGDTAGKIARIHGIRLDDLIAANGLNASATIYVDQTLTIPGSVESTLRRRGPLARTSADTLPESGPVEKNVEKTVAEPPTLIARTETPPPRRPDHEAYRLELLQSDSDEGATVGGTPPSPVSVSRRNDGAGPAPHLRAGTGDGAMDPAPPRPTRSSSRDRSAPAEPQDTAEAGPSPDRPEMSRGAARRDNRPAGTPARRRLMDTSAIVAGNLSVEDVLEFSGGPVAVIRVEVEETIGHYAEWAGVRAGEIRRLNEFGYGRPIHLGQRVKIPLRRVSRENFEEKRYEYHKELVEDFMASYRIEDLQAYTIKRGDNIWTLARDEFELPLWLIRRYNTDLDLNALMPSQTLLIPIVEKDA
jgi:membrane-bound lytic murein transglycosylase D